MSGMLLFACGICAILGSVTGCLCARPPDKPSKSRKPLKAWLTCALCEKRFLHDTRVSSRAQGWRWLPGIPGPTCKACVAARGRDAVIASVRFGGNWIQKWK